MKFENKATFQPVTMVLETEKELTQMKLLANWSRNALGNVSGHYDEYHMAGLIRSGLNA
jgi:hypothetical protein